MTYNICSNEEDMKNRTDLKIAQRTAIKYFTHFLSLAINLVLFLVVL